MTLEQLDFVRATYWIGAIAGAFSAVALLLPAGSTALGLTGQRVPGAAGRPAIIAAVLMLGWSATLIWAHLRTRERRSVLTIAMLVLLALAGVNVALAVTGELPWAEIAPTLAVQVVLAVMFGVSGRIARQAALRV